jgi:transposase-like protein
MKTNCPHFLTRNSVNLTKSCQNPSPKLRLIIRNGHYFRNSDSRKIEKFYCKACEVYFSRESFKTSYRQKKRRVNCKLNVLLCSGVSQRRAALILGINRKTVASRLKFLGSEARTQQTKFLERYTDQKLNFVQWDDLETAEHSKCKPLSVALAVEPKTRKILGFQVSQMPAKGHLAKMAYRKYGYRRDQRARGWSDLFLSLTTIVNPKATFLSDENPHYPKAMRKHFPDSIHQTVKGRRGCIAGQGELKKIGFDPLFDLNHTCAMFRANVNRLFRRTWCMTKNREALADHLAMYVAFHNLKLTD